MKEIGQVRSLPPGNRENREVDAPARTRRRSPIVAAVRHAIDVLRCLSSAQKALGVSEIARRIGLHKSSVSRILVTLEEAHLVERDREANRFTLGIGLISLAAPLISDLRLFDIAKPMLEQLAKDTGETVSLNVWDGEAAVSVQQAPGANAIRHFAPPGMRNPPHCTAAGKALVAALSPAEMEHVLDKAPIRHTARTEVDRNVLRAEIEQIRRQGFALNQGEFESDVGAVASIIRNHKGAAEAALVVTVPIYRFKGAHKAALIGQITSAADKLSRRLGYTENR